MSEDTPINDNDGVTGDAAGSSDSADVAKPMSKYDDPRIPLLAAARSGAIALAVLTVGSLLVWGGKDGMRECGASCSAPASAAASSC